MWQNFLRKSMAKTEPFCQWWWWWWRWWMIVSWFARCVKCWSSEWKTSSDNSGRFGRRQSYPTLEAKLLEHYEQKFHILYSFLNFISAIKSESTKWKGYAKYMVGPPNNTLQEQWAVTTVNFPRHCCECAQLFRRNVDTSKHAYFWNKTSLLN
jgi:hypothetical protein